MDVSRINVVLGLSLLVSVSGLGCAESQGYIEYASIPAPAPVKEVREAPVSAATDSGDMDSTATTEPDPTDSRSKPPAENRSAPAVTDATANTVEPAVVADSDAAGRNVVPAANSVADTAKAPLKLNSEGAPADPAVDSTQPTGEATAVANYDGVESTEPLEIKLLVPEKRFRQEGNDGSLRVSYDDIDLLKVLNMQPVPVDAVQHFPEWLAGLDGQRIRIRGFMYPTFEATGLTRFTLARDNGICCFVREPKIYDIIAIRLADGETSDYIDNKPFDVEGVFRIVPEADGEELYQLYRIEDAKVLR